MPSRPRWPVVARRSSSLLGVLPQSLPPPSLCTTNAGTCALAMAQFPWASKSKESAIKKKKNQYQDKMSSGEQTCQHLPGDGPCPPGALTPQTICSGLQGQGVRTQTPVQHLFHMTACRSPTVFLHMWLQGNCFLLLEGEKHKTAEFEGFLKCLTDQGDARSQSWKSVAVQHVACGWHSAWRSQPRGGIIIACLCSGRVGVTGD